MISGMSKCLPLVFQGETSLRVFEGFLKMTVSCHFKKTCSNVALVTVTVREGLKIGNGTMKDDLHKHGAGHILL